MSQVFNIHAAKTNLSKLVKLVAGGEEIIIAVGGKPVARMTALAQQPVNQSRFGFAKDAIQVADLDAFYAADKEIAAEFSADWR